MEDISVEARVRRWITCLAVVKFDIDEGQMVEHLLPPNSLSKAEEKSLAMLAFPDSNSFDGHEGTLKYIFRLRRSDGSYSFGFTCFKQKKDSKQFRGYFQKSLVLLSDMPLLQFYEKLVEFLVFKAFPNNECSLDQLQMVIRQIAQWPDPSPYVTAHLDVLGYKFQVEVPGYLKEHMPTQSPGKSNEESPLRKRLQLETIQKHGYFQDSVLFEPFKDSIELLWHIWEMVLLNKPFLILSDKPHHACHAILASISLISPLEYASEYKTYLTVYDPDFLAIQKSVENKTVQGLIVGATNPLFLKVLKNFPCLINIEQSYKKNLKQIQTYTRPDRDFCKQLLDSSCEEKIAINQALLRKYFRRFTQIFLQRFEEYFRLQKNVFKIVTQDLKRFDRAEFMKYLKKQEVVSPACYDSRSHQLRLYEQFCQSSNFRKYLSNYNVLRLQQP